jgi:hypothetical protein
MTLSGWISEILSWLKEAKHRQTNVKYGDGIQDGVTGWNCYGKTEYFEVIQMFCVMIWWSINENRDTWIWTLELFVSCLVNFISMTCWQISN